LLAAAGVGSGLGIIVGAVLPEFLGQPGVPDGLAVAAGRLAVAEVAGGQAAVDAVLPEVEAALWADPDFQAGVRVTVADVLDLVDTTLSSVPDIQQALGAVVTMSVTDLAGSVAVRAFVADQLGPPFGGAVADLLANAQAVGDVASALGSAVTQLLGYPGFSTALTDAADQFANALLDGDSASAALGIALKWLDSNAAYLAGVNAVVPNTVSGILADPVVRGAIGVAAKEAIIAELQQVGINNRFLDGVAGQVVEGTVDALLMKTAVISLIDSVAVDVLTGTPVGDVSTLVFQEVIGSPGLQIALGVSIGQGIGSLFGNNLIGDLIGVVAAVPVTLVIGVASGIIDLYQWLFGGPGVGAGQAVPAGQALGGGGRLVPPLAAAGVSRDEILTAGGFTLAGLTLTGPDGDRPGSVDIAVAVAPVTVGQGGQQGGSVSSAPVIVSFGFPLDRLVAMPASSSVAVGDARTFQQVV
jgi:hypothetical protein